MAKDYGIKVVRTGFDVATAGILDQSFNSGVNTLKLGVEGLVTSTANGARSVDISHGLGYVPGFLVWFDVDSSGKWYPMYTVEDVSGKNGFVNPFADSTNLTLNFGSDSGATIRAYYVLLVDAGL